MPAIVARTGEKMPYFVKALGRDTLLLRQLTEKLRGTDPLIVVPPNCKGLGWLREVLPEVYISRQVEGTKLRGFLYSDLEFILGGLVRVHEDFKNRVFKDVLFSPDFLYRIGVDIGKDPRFDSATLRLSTVVLMREVADFATRVLEKEEERYTASKLEDFVVIAPAPPYEGVQAAVEGLTFGMLECVETGRLGLGAAVLMWFGCRYQEAARMGADAEVGPVVETMLAARRMFARREPDKASLSTARGGGRAFLTWVKERGHVLEARLDDIEHCKESRLVAASLIERLGFHDETEVGKAFILKNRWTRLLNTYPLLKAMMGTAADTDIARMIVQLSDALLKTNLKVLSSEAQVASLEDALGSQMDVIEAISTGGRREVEPAQRTRIIVEAHAKIEKAGKEKDPQVGASTTGMLGMQAALACVLESQDFRETAASIEDFMSGSILMGGGRGDPPPLVDVFLKCISARYLFLTRFLLGRVTLSTQVVTNSTFLASLQGCRMVAASVTEAKLVSDALVRILLPKALGTEDTIRSMLGYVYPLEDCFKIVSGKWSEVDWEVLLSHAPEAHKSKLSLEAYYDLHDSAGKGRAMIFTSIEEMTALEGAMGKVFSEVLGYDRDDYQERSFSAVFGFCREALATARTIPLQSYDIVAKVNLCLLDALKDAGANYMKWLGMNTLAPPFPSAWLPKDSKAMRPLELMLETAERLAEQHAELPFVAKQMNMSLTEQGAYPHLPPCKNYVRRKEGTPL